MKTKFEWCLLVIKVQLKWRNILFLCEMLRGNIREYSNRTIVVFRTIFRARLVWGNGYGSMGLKVIHIVWLVIGSGEWE